MTTFLQQADSQGLYLWNQGCPISVQYTGAKQC